jgi:hypothetical protein
MASAQGSPASLLAASVPQSAGVDALILLGDVGGTSARFALVCETTGASVASSKIFERKYRSNSADNVAELIQLALRDAEAELGTPNIRQQIVICSIAVCGPVINGRAVLLAPSFGPDGTQAPASPPSTCSPEFGTQADLHGIPRS